MAELDLPVGAQELLTLTDSSCATGTAQTATTRWGLAAPDENNHVESTMPAKGRAASSRESQGCMSLNLISDTRAFLSR